MKKLLIMIILFVFPNVSQAMVKSWAGNTYTGLYSEMTGTYADGSRFYTTDYPPRSYIRTSGTWSLVGTGVFSESTWGTIDTRNVMSGNPFSWITVGGIPADYTTVGYGNATWATSGHTHLIFEPSISSGNATQYWNGDKSWKTLSVDVQAVINANSNGWMTAGAIPSAYTTVGYVQGQGFTTIGYVGSTYATVGYVLPNGTAWTTGQWRSMLGSTTFWGSCSSTDKMTGITDAGRIVCGADAGGAPDPSQFIMWTSLGVSAGNTLTASGWVTVGNAWGTCNVAKALNGDHCANCHAVRTIKAATASAEYSWSSVGTLGETELAWATFTSTIINKTNTSMKVVARGLVWTTKGGTGITKFSLKWGTIGVVVAGATEIGWATVSTATLVTAPAYVGYTFDCMVQWNSIASAVTANAGCVAVLGGTIAGTSWMTFTMNTTVGSKIIVSTTQSPWTTAVGAFKKVQIGQISVEKGSE